MLSSNEIKMLLMIRNRSGSIFSKLPKELIIKEIGGINGGVNARNALECAINTRYEELFNILSICPSIMFKNSKVKDINGEMIETSVVKYALYALDLFALKLCFHLCIEYDHNSSYFESFKKQIKEVEGHVNLKVLFDAYGIYMEQFDQHLSKLISTDLLLESWLNVGKAQREILPRHMLRKMCILPVALQPASHDIILISLQPEDTIDSKKLNEISKYDHTRPLLIKKDNKFLFCRFDFFKNQWDSYGLAELPFNNIEFPSTFNQPELRNRNNDFKLLASNYWPWQECKKANDANYYMQEPVFASEDRFENLLLVDVNSKLGVEFTLARGNSAMCFSVANPTGEHELLKYKAADDLQSFQKLLEKGISEIEDFSKVIDEKISTLGNNSNDDVSNESIHTSAVTI